MTNEPETMHAQVERLTRETVRLKETVNALDLPAASQVLAQSIDRLSSDYTFGIGDTARLMRDAAACIKNLREEALLAGGEVFKARQETFALQQHVRKLEAQLPNQSNQGNQSQSPAYWNPSCS